MGNRLDSGWAYNEVDELNAGSGYAYDMKGALEYDPSAAGDARLHFQYGSDDLLRQIDREGSTPLNQTSMTWDADEQRLQLTEQVSYDRWQFLYDAAVGIPAVLVQRTADQDNTTLGVTVYVREPGGELLASFEPGAGATYYHFDALGSTVLLSDSSGNPDGAYAYGAWGDVLAASAAWQPYQYVGQLGYYAHTASQGAEVADWLQLGVRFYQPELGRFEQPGSPYSYAANRPTVAVQPTATTLAPPASGKLATPASGKIVLPPRKIKDPDTGKIRTYPGGGLVARLKHCNRPLGMSKRCDECLKHSFLLVDGQALGYGPGGPGNIGTDQDSLYVGGASCTEIAVTNAQMACVRRYANNPGSVPGGPFNADDFFVVGPGKNCWEYSHAVLDACGISADIGGPIPWHELYWRGPYYR